MAHAFALIACCLLVLVGSADGHKQSPHRDGSGSCKTIHEVLHSTNGLDAFAKGLEAANVSFLNGALFYNAVDHAACFAEDSDKLRVA